MKSKKVTDPEILRQLNSEELEDNENLLQKAKRYGLKAARYGIQDPAIGLLNMGQQFANLPNKLSGGYIPELSPSDYNFSEALGVKDPDTTDKLIQFAGQYVPSFAIPGVGLGRAGQAISKIPGAGRFISRAISEALPQAAYSAAQSPHDSFKAAEETGATMAPLSAISELMKSSNKTVRGVAQALSAGLGGLLGRQSAQGLGFGEFGSDTAALIGGALGGRHFSSEKDALRKLTEGVDPYVAEERLKAAKKLGLYYLTPAEASVNPFVAKQQGTLGKTSEGSRLLYERGKKRQNSEEDAIRTTLNMIYSPSKMDDKVKDAYRSLEDSTLPMDFPIQYKNNSIIDKAKKMVETEPAYQESLKELMPRNFELKEGQSDPQSLSVVYWDHIKRAMDDMVGEAKKSGKKNVARIISNTRSKMLDKMDEAFPEYKEARSLYERKIAREGLEKVFDQKEMTGSNFYRALASEKKFNELMGHLKKAPEAQENLKAMRLLFKDLMGPPTIKTAKGTEERGMNQSRSTGAFLENLLENSFSGGKHDTAAIKFITSKDWLSQMKKLNEIPDKQLKLAAIALSLSKGISQAAGSQDD